MTEQQNTPGRIDLRTIESLHSPNADRIIANAIARSDTGARIGQFSILSALQAQARIGFAAAAILLVIAVGTVALTEKRAAAGEPETVLADWSRSNHVPTNGELLSTFQRYGR
jgi:hypothetical protein